MQAILIEIKNILPLGAGLSTNGTEVLSGYSCQNSSNYTLKICAFYCLYILAQEAKMHVEKKYRL